jgi:demethylmenaquinone methyltransferase/2-methoxy-6-polyprenyl-1,4-benzoquinol methylase
MDAYALDALAGRRFDAVFAGFWWSHVPLQRLPAWLEALHALLPAGARVVFIDNAWVEGDSTPIAWHDAAGNGWQRRTLDDGTVHEVLKNFPTREQAFAMLGLRAQAPQWCALEHFWLLDYSLS